MADTTTPKKQQGKISLIQPIHELIKIKNQNLNIYRILEVEHLFNIFESKFIGLTSPHKWEDPYERFLTSCFAIDKDNENISHVYSGFAKGVYGQCWTLKKESDAIWRIYSPSRDRVKIKTTISKLRTLASGIRPKSFSSYIGLITYQDEKFIIEKIKKLFRTSIHYIMSDKIIREFYFTKRGYQRFCVNGNFSTS